LRATCWRRFAEWTDAGVWDALHLVLLDRLGEQGLVDWSRVLVDAASLRVKRGGPYRRKSGRPCQAREQDPSGHRYLTGRRIASRIARRGIESSTRLGRHRWKVERSLAWLSCYKRVQVRWERCSGQFFGFVVLACALLCFNALRQPRF
jgi:transposase